MEVAPLLDQIGLIIERHQGRRVVVPFDTGIFSLDKDVLEQVGTLLEGSSVLMSAALDHYDQLCAESDGDALDRLSQMPAATSSEVAAQQIASVAFVGNAQVRELGEELQRAKIDSNHWRQAALSDTAVRETVRALIALESAMLEYEGLPQKERQWAELEDSLEIRLLYTQLRRTVIEGGEPRDREELVRRLRKSARRIAILRDLKIYPFLRISDRLEIRGLQKRIMAWLERADSDRQSGLRLWQDLASFSRLLRQINRREEVREHDRRTVLETYRMLFGAFEQPTKMPAATRQRLESLAGRDDQLDSLLRLREALTPDLLRTVLERLKVEVQGSHP